MTAPHKDEIGWKFWQRALKGKSIDVPRGIVPIGYYRKNNRSTGVWYPVAIWIGEDGAKRYQVGQAEVRILDTAEKEEDFDTDTFAWIGKTPITHEQYQHWTQHRDWPEDMGLKPIVKTTAPREAKIGDNSGASAEDIEAMTLEALVDQVASAKATAAGFAKITSQEQGNTAQGLSSRLTQLAGEGDKQREVEKRPHLEAGRAVDEAWNPIIKEAKAAARALKDACAEFATSEKRRIAAEREAAAAVGAMPTEPAPAVEFKGAQGQKATARTYLAPTIVDYDVVYQQLKTNPEIRAILDKLVLKIYRNYAPGMNDMNGVRSEEKVSIR